MAAGKSLQRRKCAAPGGRYREGTLILETDFETDQGVVRIIDCMPLSNKRWDVLRVVEGIEGQVTLCMELVIRFDYGSIIPWVRRIDGTLVGTAGPDTLELHTEVEVHGENMKTVAEFRIDKGERRHFSLKESLNKLSREATDERDPVEFSN